MTSLLLALGLATALMIGSPAVAGAAGPQPRLPDVRAPQACCAITAIDLAGGVVTARETQTGRVFQFRVSDRAVLGSLRVGQPVYADFSTNQVAVTAGKLCCPIVAPGASPSPPPTAGRAAAPSSQGPTATQAAVSQNILNWFAQRGGRFHAATDPMRPAILLVHGVHNSALAWMRPADDPGVEGYYYDHRQEPSAVKLENQYPGVGIYKEGKSNRSREQVNALNWFDYLVSQNFTVATWSQPGETFQDAYPSAEQAYEQFVNATRGPIALVAHSRGGLLVRAVLKGKVLKQQIGVGRLRWVVTLHSPHTGSELAAGPQILFDEVGLRCNDVAAPAEWLLKVKTMCKELMDYLARRSARPGSLELAPGGQLFAGLAQGEAPVPGVSYFTFGGTTPTYIRYYLWHFTAESAVPQYKCDPAPPNCKQYFKWEAVPKPIAAISPMYDVVRDVVPEIKPGYGDGLVADARARLPFATHTTTGLNHAEVLWNRALQARVVQLLSTQILPGRR